MYYSVKFLFFSLNVTLHIKVIGERAFQFHDLGSFPTHSGASCSKMFQLFPEGNSVLPASLVNQGQPQKQQFSLSVCHVNLCQLFQNSSKSSSSSSVGRRYKKLLSCRLIRKTENEEQIGGGGRGGEGCVRATALHTDALSPSAQTLEGSRLIDVQTSGPVVTMRHTVLLSEATRLLSLRKAAAHKGKQVKVTASFLDTVSEGDSERGGKEDE